MIAYIAMEWCGCVYSMPNGQWCMLCRGTLGHTEHSSLYSLHSDHDVLQVEVATLLSRLRHCRLLLRYAKYPWFSILVFVALPKCVDVTGDRTVVCGD